MLYFEWKEEDALKYAKEEGYEDGFEAGEQIGMARGTAYGEKKEREELIRKFSKICTPEQIAETLQTSKEYVIDVLKHDMCVCEPKHSYSTSKES